LTAEHFLRLDPTVRMICGIVLFVGIMLTDPTTQAGMLAVAVPGAAALLLHRRGIIGIFGIILAGSVLYLPAIFWSPPGIVVKGLSAAIAILAPASALSPQEVSVVVMRLPLPAFFRFLVLQVLHQSGVLVRETQAVHRAVAVRGGVHGLRGIVVFSRALPQTWLPRVAVRAERVAIAMALRGYGTHRPEVDPVALGVTGGVALVCSGVLAGAVVWLFPVGG
jgi:energy-coupling factor transporter transmembrane protein EcfT